jgi:hypothetical protein
MNGDNETTSEFMTHATEYWEFAKWAFLILFAVVLMLIWPLRRPGKAFGVLLLGLYGTFAWFFMSNYEHFALDVSVAIGITVVVGVVVLSTFYYFVFIRTS